MSEQTLGQMPEDSVKGSAKRRNDPVPEELYEKIYNDVMSEVQKNLSQMKPQLVREIADMAAQKVAEAYEKKIHILEQKVSLLMSQMKSLQKPIKPLTPPSPTPSVSVAPPSALSPTSEKKDRIDVSRIYGGFRFDGWIYYANRDMGDFLYKVREDGSENTQLTDYSVMSRFSIANGYLSFRDADYNDRKIKLG